MRRDACGWRRLGVQHRVLQLRRSVRKGIEHWNEVRALFRRAIDLAIGINSGRAPVGGDEVMHVTRGRAPVPGSDDDVALYTLRSRRLVERQLAGSNAIGPVTKQRQSALLVKSAQYVDHLGHGLT